ncbi:hypothetical protein BpHYR1_050391 [Brachionus plicatilis]|uniref:Uncharacterized protein n=1 Tax=Brachionus plicatilis TaxID=10195 RepID=A0A3M7SBT7_BRAPC|nr:hypothetical protein BpHYR1_050391 [Brachionus plicatilis]
MNHSENACVSAGLIMWFSHMTCLKRGEITLSQKKRALLYFDRHYYRLSSKNLKGKSILRCVVVKCHGSCYTYSETVGDNCEVWLLDEFHLESHDPIKITNLEHRRKLKEKAADTDEAPRKIISPFEMELGNDLEVIEIYSSYDALRQMINRVKGKNSSNYPREPIDLKLGELLEFLTKIKEENFLLYDSGPVDLSRFVIFTITEDLKTLENNHIFFDGTFDIAPKPFF